ncbi:hypothetical protein V5799_009701 [Amblyomma americanum]|uniref:Uncharacterized protein n=1 Tax=Amblyomma americanum TaxID=6943 RepID=A0AAQ4FA40_AMBAM
MLHRMPSLTGPLFRGQNESSLVHGLRKSKITMIVTASLLVLVVTGVALGFVFSGPRRNFLDSRSQQPAMAGQVMGNFSFDTISGFVAVAQAGGSSRHSVGRVPAELEGQGTNKTR